MRMSLTVRPRVCVALAVSVAATVVLHQCRASWGEQVDSIHFNSGQPDFGTVPRRGLLSGETELHLPPLGTPDGSPGITYGDGVVGQAELSPERSEQIAARNAARDVNVRRTAKVLLARLDWKDAEGAYERLADENLWSGDLRDRVEVLDETRSIAAAARPNRLILRYFESLDRMYTTDGTQENAAAKILAEVAADPSAGFLRPHALYEIASLHVEWLDFSKAAVEFRALLREYPNCIKRQAAIVMLARATLLPEVRDSANVEIGARAVETLLAEYPHGRFRKAALGLRARADFVNGRYTRAVQTYFRFGDMSSVENVLAVMPPDQRKLYRLNRLAGWLRSLNDANSFDSYGLADRYVRESMASLSVRDASRFVELLGRDRSLVAPYLYYRLYLCDNNVKDVDRLGALAERLIPRYRGRAGISLTPVIEIRLAETSYQRRRYKDAIAWATRAEAHFASRRPYDRAIYVIGASLHKLGRDQASIRTFEQLLKECPDSSLRFGAHEELALLREITGDEEGALSEYFALNYRPDIAYFLDGRLTTGQVAHYLAAHPCHREHDLLVYSLGVRYLRDENWNAARRLLSALPRPTYVRFGTSQEDNGYRAWDSSDGPDPLKAATDLSPLSAALARPSTANLRASALFRFADYYYKSPLLLLYNGALWKGEREFNFDFFWNAGHATRTDDAFTSRYMHDHETYARAERICRQIVSDYPSSPTRPYALYRAGCCEAKLANFNGWWRDDKAGDHYRIAARYMAQLAREYPHHELAKEARKFARDWGTSYESEKRAGAATESRGKPTPRLALRG